MYNCGSTVAVDAPSFQHATEGECMPSCDQDNNMDCSFTARYGDSIIVTTEPEGNVTNKKTHRYNSRIKHIC